MKKSAVPLLLILIVAAISIPKVYALPREEIKLTTIIPDQQVLRVKKGIISTTNYRQANFPDSSIPANSLIVEGNVGIGTVDPKAKLEVNGEVKIGNTGLTCSSSIVGAMRYDPASNTIQYCDGNTWKGMGARSFGSYVSKSLDTDYQAETDGFVLAWGTPGGSISVKVDSSSPPTTYRARADSYNSSTGHAYVCVPVKKNDWYRIEQVDLASVYIYWMPLE